MNDYRYVIVGIVVCFLDLWYRIRDILVRIRIRGIAPLTKDPKPALFVSGLQDTKTATKNIFFPSLLLILLLEGTVH